MNRSTTNASPPIADVVLALVFVALTQAEVWVFAADDGFTIGVRLSASTLTLVASAALAYRRQRPAVSFLVNGAAVIGTILAGYPSDIYQYTSLVATYSLGAYATNAQRWAGLPLSIAGVLAYFIRFPFEGGPAIAAFAVAMWVVAWLAGRTYGARIEEVRLRAERDLSRRLAEANEERLALEEERNRIARELHDIVGHTVNVMVVHAEAGRRELTRDVGNAERAFETIARTGREALSELDRVLAVLRRDEGDPALEHTPGIGDLGRLAQIFSDTGLAVDVELSGDPGTVPASVGLATYRIIQEALTNTLKHASAERAKVTVAVGTGAVELKVADDGRGPPDDAQAGRGMMGMHERATLHGGSVDFVSDGGAGLTVSAQMRWDHPG